MPFEKGESGNPAGRPVGAKDKRTALRELLEPHAGELVTKAVEMAKGGDMAALRLCIDRLVPPAKARAEPSPIDGMTGEPEADAHAVVRALAVGAVGPDEAATILGALAAHAKIIEASELARRIEVLEANLANGRP